MPTIADKIKQAQEKTLLKFRGVVFIEIGQLRVPISDLFGQSLVLGATGSGKTEFLKWVVYQVLKKTDIDVVVVDGKGDYKLSNDLCVMANELGIGPVPVVKHGWKDGCESSVFNPWIGSNVSICNRLIMMLGLQGRETDAEHYRIPKRDLLHLICGINLHKVYPEVAPFDPPRSFGDLQTMLTLDWFDRIYKKSPEATAKIMGYTAPKTKDSTIDNFRREVETITKPFLHLFDSSGFNLGEHRVSVFSFDAVNVPHDAEPLMRLCAGAFQNHMQSEKPTLYLFDEPSPLGPKNLMNFINMGRGKNAATMVFTQNLATLDSERSVLDQIVQGVNLKFFFKNDIPELLDIIGKDEVPDVTHRTENGVVTSSNVGTKTEYRVKSLEELKDGKGYMKFGGKVTLFQSPMYKSVKVFDQSMEYLNAVEPKKPQKGNNVEAVEPD